MDSQRKVSRAVTKLAQTKPFWGSLMLSIGHSKNDSIPTAATDGLNIWWNDEFIQEQSEAQTRGLMCHELMHIILHHCMHHGEPYDSNPKMCNIAMDYVINNTLMEDGFELPEGGIIDKDGKFKGMTWKQVYNLIKDDPEHQDMCKELTLEDVMKNPNLSDAEKAEIQQKVVAAAQAAKNSGVGKLPGELEELINEIRNPKVDWKEYLWETFKCRYPEDYTFNRPNRKVLNTYDIYLPTMEGVQAGNIAVHIDTSGSVSSDELTDFLAELNELSVEFKPACIYIFYTDYAVANVEVFEQGDDITELNIKGRGGTSFVPTFEYIEEHDIAVDQMLVFSDMEVWDGCFPAEEPDYPVLFLSTRDDYDVPFRGMHQNPIGGETMLNDKLAGMTENELKTQLQAERILNENQTYQMDFIIRTADEVSLNITTETKTYTYGSHSWTRNISYTNLYLKDDWYDKVYLQGIGCVTYKNRTTLVLDAEEQPIELLRSDLRMPDTKVFKVQMPIFSSEASGPKTRWGYQPTKLVCQQEERFMVATPIAEGEASICYAALHVNAAGANLKRNLMKQMTNLMGV